MRSRRATRYGWRCEMRSLVFGVAARERGFLAPMWLYLIGGIAFLAMLYGLVAWVDTHWETSAGVKKGKAAVQAQWDQAAREQRQAEEKRIQDASTKKEQG